MEKIVFTFWLLGDTLKAQTEMDSKIFNGIDFEELAAYDFFVHYNEKSPNLYYYILNTLIKKGFKIEGIFGNGFKVLAN